MICPNCNSQINESTNFCPNCGLPLKANVEAIQHATPLSQTPIINTQQPQQSNSMTIDSVDEKEKRPIYEKWWFWVLIAVVFIMIVYPLIGRFFNVKPNNSSQMTPTTSFSDSNTNVKTVVPTTNYATTVKSTEAVENTYDNNQYYEIVEIGNYVNSIGTQYIIHKVYAKQDVSVSSTAIATDSFGNVIGKSTDDIILSKGQYNYFSYFFDVDITDASVQFQANTTNDSFLTGVRNGVELVTYNQSGNDLYLTFKQTVNTLGAIAKFKILFYKGDDIVNTEYGYFSTYAKNLKGINTTDVAKVWVYGVDFDRIEYIYEP